jgi:hypothetical protein
VYRVQQRRPTCQEYFSRLGARITADDKPASPLQNHFGFAICVGFALRERLPAAIPPTVFDNRPLDAHCHLTTAQSP